MKSHVDRLRTLATRSGVIRAKDAAAAGVPREYLPRLAAKGLFVRVGRGLYVLSGTEGSAQHALAEVAKAVPRSIVCLLTALRFHELTTQNPSEIWLAVPNKARRPRQIAWRVEVVYMSSAAFKAGIETHRIDDIPVRIYSAAKTVADCFKFRNRIGLDVAVEALRDYLRRNRGGANALWQYAKICRVTRVMQPYLEAVA
jgi:predicted transcriptional regulator of viral defense system